MGQRAQWQPTDVAAVARDVAEALRGNDNATALRCVVQLLDDLARVTDEMRLQLVREEPPSTSDPRWDALIAGVVEHICHRYGLPVPAWTVDPSRFLDRWWFAVPTPALAASAFTETPAALANRGVFIHAASLESV